MSDFERYGDYNEIDEAPGKSKVGLVIKIIALTLCFSVVGLLALRIISFNYYPKEMKTLYFNESLTSFYNEKNGDISALTQKLRSPYDHAEEGNFIADNLIVIPEVNQLQLSVRYNISIADTLANEYGLSDFDTDDFSKISFRLYKSGESKNEEDHLTGNLSYSFWDSFLMYRYCKLVFDGVDLGLSEGAEKTEWIRIEIFIEGIEKPFMIPIFENNSDYSDFEGYELSAKEKP